MLTWASHKHRHTTDSTCYAEYVSLHEATHELLFLHQLLDGLGFGPVGPTPLYCNDNFTRQLTEDQHWHANTRHFRIRYHTIRDLVNLDELQVVTTNNTANILTKALACPVFERLHHFLDL
jgi:hypothetical protein